MRGLPKRWRHRVVVATVVLAALVSATAAFAFHSYTAYAPNQSYNPGQGNGSAYDVACDRWNDNRMEKNGSGNYGTLAWIDTGGGWQVSVRTKEWIMDYGISNVAWTKKLHGNNSSSVTYTATLKGHGDFFEPGCV